MCRCFTLNNWTPEEKEQLIEKIKELCAQGIFQEEIGENGTPHLQGFINLKTKSRPVGAFQIPRIHWEKAKGTLKQNITYCSKDDTRAPGTVPWTWKIVIPARLNTVTYAELRPWQKLLVDSMKTPQQKFARHVHWRFDDGKQGKSIVTQHVIDHEGALVCGGKQADIFYMIAQWVQKHGPGLPLVVFDLTRTHQNYVSYTAIESILNGYFFSGKFEATMVRFNPPRLLVFANYPPKLGALTPDRWDIRRIALSDGECVSCIVIPSELLPPSRRRASRRPHTFPGPWHITFRFAHGDKS